MRHGRPRGGEARRGRGRCNHLAGRVRNGASPPSWAYRHAALHVSARWRSLTAVLNAIGRRGVGTLEQRQRWWVHWLETLSMRAFPLCGALVPRCVDRIWLVWCFRARCAWHLLRLAHSIPSGAGSASAATHHHSGGSQLHLGRVPTRSTRSSARL